MAEEGLKDFTINWVLAGFLMFSLLAFAITFMFNNNPLGFGDDGDLQLGSSSDSLNSQLFSIEENSNELLNITANTNPEISLLGSRDSVATSYSSTGTAKSYWESGRLLMSWIFSGAIGKMLISVIGGIIGLLSFFYIAKWIRTGT